MEGANTRASTRRSLPSVNAMETHQLPISVAGSIGRHRGAERLNMPLSAGSAAREPSCSSAACRRKRGLYHHALLPDAELA